jgi:hypothetical protein
MEGSGAVQNNYRSGCGSRRPKNIRIRIRNTAWYTKSFKPLWISPKLLLRYNFFSMVFYQNAHLCEYSSIEKYSQCVYSKLSYCIAWLAGGKNTSILLPLLLSHFENQKKRSGNKLIKHFSFLWKHFSYFSGLEKTGFCTKSKTSRFLTHLSKLDRKKW